MVVIGLLPGPDVGIMLMAPPLVDIIADEPSATVIVRGLATLALLTIDTAPPDVTTDELAPKFTDGAIRFKALPPATVKVVLAPRLIEPGVVSTRFLKSTAPVGPALKV